MSGYWQVTSRPATAEEQQQIDALLRELVADGDEHVAGAAGGGRIAWGCGAAALAIPLVFVLPVPKAISAVAAVALIVVAALLGGKKGAAEAAGYVTAWRDELARKASGEQAPDPVEVIEAEIDGAVLVDYYSEEGLYFLVLDFGGELAVVNVPQDFEWTEFFESRPLHRRFRLRIHEQQILGYEALSDDVVPQRTEELVPDGDPDGEQAVSFDALHEQSSDWGEGRELRRIPGTLATWRDDVRRARATAGPASLSRAESEEDGERGLSQPE